MWPTACGRLRMTACYNNNQDIRNLCFNLLAMVRRYQLPGGSSALSDTMSTRRGSSNLTSDRPILTPFSRRSSPRPNLATPSSTSEVGSQVHETTSGPESRSREDSHVPFPSPFIFGEPRSPPHLFDPDTPIPSVERASAADSDQQSSASTVRHTPSRPSESQSTAQDVNETASLRGLSGLGDLRITPSRPSPSPAQRAPSTPSIHVTSSPPLEATGGSRSGRSDSLIAGVGAIRMDSQRADSLSPAGAHERQSPSPSPRRRSGSGVRREIHHVDSESPPEALSRMAEVQEALMVARALTGRITTLLSSSSLVHENGSSIQTLHRQAMRLDGFQLPSSRTIGLVGDSGVGKSSLINSLLDKSGLARAGASGTACTCAVTEFHFHDRDDFVVHVDFFSLDQLKQQFEELLRAHRDFEALEPTGRNERGDDQADSDRPHLERKAALAIGTFNAGFRDRLEALSEILSTVPFDRAITTMLDWTSDSLPTHGQEMSYDTIEECSTWLGGFSSEAPLNASTRSQTAYPPWPFIQKIRVYVKASILSKGLIIADLPGLRDLNSARQAITERYVRHCHQILVVAKIDRAITDESIKYICELARRVDLQKIDIVCTRSEEINSREAKHDWPGERATIENMQQVINERGREIASLREDIDDLEQDGTGLTREQERELLDLQRDYRKAEKSKMEQELELQRFIVQLRNNKVSHELRQTYRHFPVAGSLRIFCVSNLVYWEHREKPADIALPYLSFSGVIELRRYCIGIVGQSRIQAIQTFIKDDIPALIGSIELWIETGSGSVSAERKQEILDAVAAIQEKLDQLTSPASRLYQISQNLRTQFMDGVYARMDRHGPLWSAGAREASLEWNGWHHSSYRAFCSKYGDHLTPTMGSHCWNEEAISRMTADLPNFWNNFTVEIDTKIARVSIIITEAFTGVIQIATTIAANMSRVDETGSAMWTFASNLRHRERLISYGIEQVTDAFESNITSLRADALSSVRTSFIGRLMESTYRAANQEYGNGSDRRRKNIMTGRFSSATLFEDHRRSCRDKLGELAQELQEKMTEVVNAQVEMIEADMQLLRDGNAILESERDLAFKRRVEEEVRAIKMEVEQLGRTFDQN